MSTLILLAALATNPVPTGLVLDCCATRQPPRLAVVPRVLPFEIERLHKPQFGVIVVVVIDFDGETLRQVQSPHARWTHTQIEDPEIRDRKWFPECYRRDLCRN